MCDMHRPWQIFSVTNYKVEVARLSGIPGIDPMEVILHVGIDGL